jgi:CD109 antigen
VKISVKSSANSFIGLLGIDQSVLLLKSGNDIDQAQVAKELLMYERANINNNRWSNDPKYVRKFYQDFQTSQTVVITNAKDAFRMFTSWSLLCQFY